MNREYLKKLAFVASLASSAAATVNCGGHFATDCSACPGQNGAMWCNGDCAWVSPGFVTGGQCVPSDSGIETQNTYSYSVGFLTSGIVMLIYACIYNRKVIRGPPEFPKVNSIMGTPRKGLFACFWNIETCLQVTFCMPVVAAKNYYATDVCPFWPSCILTFLGTYSPFYCITALVRAVLTGRVQEKLGNKSNFPLDCITALFCFPCDVGRESLEVDQEVGADVRCCCQVSYA